MIAVVKPLLKQAITLVSCASPAIDLFARLYVANIFWKSGLTKISNMELTVQLFTDLYAVPILPPAVAAYMATGAELVFPVLLVLGLAGRFAALSLSILNVVAVISFPDLHDAGKQQHLVWGLLLLFTLFHGPGKLSIDYFIRKKFWD